MPVQLTLPGVAEETLPIVDALVKCGGVFDTHERALVSISGGSDSDMLLDICERVRRDHPIEIDYVWFDTGMEYRATREHLGYLEGRYGITIRRVRARKTVAVCCRDHGLPFLSKFVSEMVSRLQSMGFGWEDGPFEDLYAKYGRNKGALRWWTNSHGRDAGRSRFDIANVPWLREFMLEQPPTFRVSNMCCEHAKKRVAREVITEGGYDLDVVGVRRSEGGIRAAGSRCLTTGHGCDKYRPLFWLGNADKELYCQMRGIRHSDCYESWGLSRTGCAGCPFGRRVLDELRVIGRFEPAMARAARSIFADSYEYTRRFREFARSRGGKPPQARSLGR